MPQSALRNLVPSINTAMNNAAQAPFGRPQRIPIYRNEPEFIDRSLNPQNYPVINNPDGSISSHRMAAEVDENGNWYVFPTIQMQPDGTLRQYDDAREAMKAAFMTGNILRAPNMKSALQYAEGGYKVGTPMEQPRSAPAQEPVQPAPDPALRYLDQMYMMGIGQGPAPARVPRTRGQTAADMLGAASLPMSLVPLAGDLTGMAADAAMYAAYPEERTMGNYAMSALGALPLIPGAAAVRAARGASPLEGTLDMSQAARMQRADEVSLPGNYYHGSQRIDRVVEKNEIDPRRATSGPMPFFTDNPDLASSYAKNKSDTSLPEGTYQDVFRVSPKDLGISGRTPITVERSWNFLDQKTKDEIRDRATRIGYENFEEGSGKLTLHPSGTDASPSKSQYDFLMRTSARGNPLAALRELWVDSGNLFNEEEKLAEIYRLAGFPAKIDQSLAPWTEAAGVLPVRLRIENPLLTTNTSEISEKVIPALEAAFKNSRTKTKPYGADLWDKNTRYTPKQWVEQLKQDILNNEDSFVWTSIPDKVTDALKNLGYDGILDKGGKMGGEAHTVAIPFRPNQVRSIFADFDPAKRESANLMAGAAGATIGLSALRNIQRDEEPKPD